METKHLLVQVIALLYRENRIYDHMSSCDLAKTVITLIKPSEAMAAIEFSKDALTHLIVTANWMASFHEGDKIDRNELLDRLRMDCSHETDLFAAIKEIIEKDISIEETKAYLDGVRKKLSAFVMQKQITDIMRKLSYQLSFQPGTVAWDSIVDEIEAQLAPFKELQKPELEQHISFIDLSDVSSTADFIRRGRENMMSHGVLRFGLQGMNEMYGEHGGLCRGTLNLINALPENCKSLWCLKYLRWAAQYNKPHMIDPKKKPLLLRISLENVAESDMVMMFKDMFENETKTPVDVKDIDPAIAGQYIVEKLGVNGYTVHFYREDSNKFTFKRLFKLISDYERNGWEIHMLNIDYVNLMSKEGCVQGPYGTETRDLFRRIRTFCSVRGITVVTPHQISTEAKKMLRAGFNPENFVRELPGKGYYDSSGTIDQEIDTEVNLHKILHNCEMYLSAGIGKHRGLTTPTPILDKVAIWKFMDVGNIPDDIDMKNTKRRRLGAATIGDGGGAAEWSDSPF